MFKKIRTLENKALLLFKELVMEKIFSCKDSRELSEYISEVESFYKITSNPSVEVEGNFIKYGDVLNHYRDTYIPELFYYSDYEDVRQGLRFVKVFAE